MNGYTKMRMSTDSIAKPRSMDLIDSNSCSPQPKQDQDFLPSPVGLKAHHRQREADHARPTTHDLFSWQQQQEEGAAGGHGQEQALGVVLSRTSSSASQRFRANGSSSVQGAVRRAFSMRKGSSVADGYWRIHDTADEDGEELREDQTQQMRHLPPMKKRGRILRACKRLFGF